MVTDSQVNNAVIGEIHCYKLGPVVFNHVFSELTIAIDSEYHGRGIGKMLFQTLLCYISENREDIYRVELVVRDSNTKAIELYKKLGFITEGRFENRIHLDNNNFEADIPMAWLNSNFAGKTADDESERIHSKLV